MRPASSNGVSVDHHRVGDQFPTALLQYVDRGVLLFKNHLVSERSLALFWTVQFQQLDRSLATTFAKHSRSSTA